MVASSLLSCLEDNQVLGMNDRGNGSRNCGKGVDLMNNGGLLWDCTELRDIVVIFVQSC